MNFAVVSLCLLACGVTAVPTPHQHLVVTVETNTDAQVDILRAAADTDHELDFWTHPRMGLTDVMVPWRRFNQLKDAWTAAGMKVKVMQEDVEAMIRNVDAQNLLYKQRRTARAGTTLDHDFYRSYAQYIDGLRSLRSQYSNLMRFDESGNSVPRNKTIEGRIIHFVELGANLDSRPVIMLEVNIHAREWVTSASDFYMIDSLVSNYGSDADATFLLDNFHLVIIPVANPDGYEFSRTSSNTRLWRKNRRYVGGIFSCYGVDLNRNFNAFWQGSGYCTSDSYPGTSYNSEPETNAVESIFRRFQNNMVIYLPVHCYSQVLLLPWSYQSTNSIVNARHRDYGNAMGAAMKASSGRNYGVGTAYATIGYAAAGTSGDWALVEKQGSNSNFISIAYELRPAPGAGTGGFILPASDIVPTGRELLASVLAVAKRNFNES
ncbi:carboxypeptidase B-like [Littorina saxatilis]|uniref:Peptidase M14 domain-containing protein n=1 Tax=Littorina saxatilis TaxID=31220 RepID=A0AAN9GCA0_9CAEN